VDAISDHCNTSRDTDSCGRSTEGIHNCLDVVKVLGRWWWDLSAVLLTAAVPLYLGRYLGTPLVTEGRLDEQQHMRG